MSGFLFFCFKWVSEPHKRLLTSQHCHHINALIKCLLIATNHTWLWTLFVGFAEHKNIMLLLWVRSKSLMWMNNKQQSEFLHSRNLWDVRYLWFSQEEKNLVSSLHSTISQALNITCASFYDFSCDFMPEMATWATAGVELADKFGVRSIETDTWCCPVMGTKILQLLLWCCPWGAEEQP